MALLGLLGGLGEEDREQLVNRSSAAAQGTLPELLRPYETQVNSETNLSTLG